MIKITLVDYKCLLSRWANWFSETDVTTSKSEFITI